MRASSLLALTHVSPRYFAADLLARGARGVPVDDPAARLRRHRGAVSRARRADARQGRRPARAPRAGSAGDVERTRRPGSTSVPRGTRSSGRSTTTGGRSSSSSSGSASCTRARVLEVGCGTGRLSAALEARELARVWAVDASEAMVAASQGERRQREGRARARRCPFKAGWFDAVVMRMVIHLIDRPRALRAGRSRPRTRRPARDRHRGPRDLRRRLVRALLPVGARDRARALPELGGARAGARGRGIPPSARSSSSASTETTTRDHALDIIRSRAFSTFDLLSPEEYDAGLAQAEAELPERFEYHFDWLLAVGLR